MNGVLENALYYPSIDFYNERWLKSVTLFRDREDRTVQESEEQPCRRCSSGILLLVGGQCLVDYVGCFISFVHIYSKNEQKK